MAAGALVPHVLPDGRTIMVPDYMAPKGGGALAMPGAAPPPSGPDLRVAGPGGGPLAGAFRPQFVEPEAAAPVPFEQQIGNALAAPKPQEFKVRDFREDRLPEIASVGEARTRADIMRERQEGAKPKAVDPASLARGERKASAEKEDGKDEEMDPMVRKVFNEALRPRGGGGRSPGLEVGSMKVEREPGRELLPEYKWAHGLEARPDLGQEIDPDAEQPTWGTADPVMRQRKTGLERGAEATGESARTEFQRQVTEQQALGLAQREELAAQSQLIDEQLGTIAARRERIAKLQETADKRMQEAESFEPRSREQVWEDKGPVAQVMGILAMAIGGYTQGLGRSGGKNPGLDIVNQIINSEVDNDKDKADRRRKIGLEAKGDYEKAMALYGDVEMATLDVRNRKLANVMAMTKQMMADRSLDETAKARGEQIYGQAYEQYMANKQQLFDQIAGKVTREEINYKPGAPTGGGGGSTSTLKALEEAARAKKAISTIAGEQTGYARSIEGDKLNDVNAAMESLDAADAVARDVRALGADSSDFDDPLSGPLDAAARVIGTGGDGRRKRQALEANTKRLARGIQQSLGKSDNDARLADEMAVGDGSGLSRLRAAETARQQALGRIQTAAAGMTPQQREAFLSGLTPERRAQVSEALKATAQQKRAASEASVE